MFFKLEKCKVMHNSTTNPNLKYENHVYEVGMISNE